MSDRWSSRTPLQPRSGSYRAEQLSPEDVAEQPTGRLGTPTDTANLVRFLLSPSGAWINGQLLYSNGGYPKGQLPH